MSVAVVVRVPAPSGSSFARGAWDHAVDKTMPVRLLDHTAPSGTRVDYDSYLIAATVVDDGKFVDLEIISYAIDDPERLDGLLIAGAQIISREARP